MTTADDLPPELKHLNIAMDALFGALEKSRASISVSVPDPQRAVEYAIMALKDFDYGYASDLFAAFQVKLENVYEEKLDPGVHDAMFRLAAALDRAYGNG